MASLARIGTQGGIGFQVNPQYAPQFQALLNDLEAAGYGIGKNSGGYNYRTIAGTNKLSNHAFGNAIDLNWDRNARGTRGDIPADLARQLAQKHGMTWGGDWKNPDPMHFEVAGATTPHAHGAQSMPTYKDVGGQVPQMAPGSSPADVAYAQRMAQMLMQGGQGTPRHWAEALGNAMQTGVGGLWQEQAARGERQGQAGANQAIAQALMGENPNWAALMQDPRTRDIGVKGLMEERALRTKMADPLYRAKIQEAQANAALGQSALTAQNEILGSGGAPIQQPQAPVPGTPPQEGVGRFANANILPPVTVEQPSEPEPMVQIGSKRVPVSKAREYQARLAANKATKPQADVIGEAIKKAELPANEAAKQNAKMEAKNKFNWPKTEQTFKTQEQTMSLMNDTIDKALKNIDWTTAGFVGGNMSGIAGTPAYDMANLLDTIRANIGFDKLQAMRDASPTGGALGQVSEFENRLLQSVRGSLQQGQSPGQLKKNLMRVRKDLNDYLEDRRNRFAQDQKKYGGGDGGLASGVYNYNPETGEFEAE
jgi:hypothetical protein